MTAKIYIDDEDENILETDLYFDIQSASSFYINIDGEMNVVVDGVMYTFLSGQDEVYNALINRFV